jgi:uncharacterized protein (DUF58 family)
VVTSRGAIAIALGLALVIAGAVYGVEEFVLLAAALGALLVAGFVALWWRWAAANKGLQVEVRIPTAEVIAGSPALAEVRVRNTGRWPTAPLWTEEPRRRWSLSHPGLSAHRESQRLDASDAVPPFTSRPTAAAALKGGITTRRASASWPRLFHVESSTLGRPLQIPGLARGEEIALAVPVPTGSRGLLTLNPLAIWCEDPLRLVAAKVASSPVAHVLVCPQPGPAATNGAKSAGGHGNRPPDASEYAEAVGMQGGYEFRTLRPYLPGDRMTRLHWPAFARSGDLVVRDFVEPVSGCLSLLVDLRPSAHEGSSIDAVVARAAGVGLAALRNGEVVELCTSAGERTQVVPGADCQMNLLRLLAVLGPVSAPMSAALRWSGFAGEAVWGPASVDGSEVVLVTTEAGGASALPQKLSARARKVVV